MIKEDKILLWGKKLLLALTVTASFSYAELINGIALTVNDDAITQLDIEEKMKSSQKSKTDAVGLLVDELLYEQEIQNNNITADIFEVNDYLEKIAASNGMDLYTFKSIVKQKYKNFKNFEAQTKQQLLKRKLASKLVQGNLKVANNDDLKLYYENNQTLFSTAARIHVTQYASKVKKALLERKQNPMAINGNVTLSDVTLTQERLNSQLRYLVNDTNTNTFTPIFTANKQYVMFYIKAKEGVTTLAFDDVKKKIFNVVMQEREKRYLKEYFEKLKLTANIKIIR